MIINLIPQDKLRQLGFMKFMAMFGSLFGFIFLGIMASGLFIYEGAFVMNTGRLVQAIGYGIFLALVTWFRIQKGAK